MSKANIHLPSGFRFDTIIPIRITDINYGGHVGNDTVLSIMHEARIQFLGHHGYTEMKIGASGLIMRDVAIEFKKELFYGENIKVSVIASDFTKVSFELYYKLEKKYEDLMVIVARAKTGMVCYDYEKKKITSLPEEVKLQLSRS